MSDIAIKICGVRDADAMLATAKAGATHVGFNFVRSSPRYIAPQKAKGVAGLAPETFVRVAVFADALDHEFEDVIRAIRPQLLQLHGRENPERVAFVRKRFGLPVMKALAIATADDLREGVEAFGEVADRLLFDSKPPSGRSGGRGRVFDWTLLSGAQIPKPWLLSGGLTPANVGEAIRVSGARGVDVASGVESEPGVKDSKLVMQFAAAARAALAPDEAS
jgi:phosphoribosylanthranilate isomerase